MIEKLSKTKAKRRLRKFFKEKNITEKLSIKRNGTLFIVNDISANPEISEAIELLKKTFLRRGELIEF